MTITCPQCQHKNPDDAEFCENCGAQLPVAVPAGVASPASVAAPAPTPAPTSAPDELVCPTCKAPYAVGDVFCFNCGSDLSKLPGNQPAAAAANGNGQSQPQAVVAAPVAAPKPADGMSEDDWDKAFAAPGNSGPAPAPVASPASTPAAPAADPDPAPVAAPPASTGFPVAAPVEASPAPATATVPTALKLHVAGPYGDEVIEYKGRELLLGRQDVKTRVFPDLNLDDGAASRRHLSIWKDQSDGQFYAQDLESSNGTVLNGRDMEPGAAIQLNNNDVIRIGTRYSIQVRIS